MFFYKTTDRDVVTAVFERLYEAALAEIHLTIEQYPSWREEEEKKWQNAEVVLVEDDEVLGASADASLKARKALIKPGKNSRRILEYPSGTRVILRRRNGQEVGRIEF